ncbi:hypothetical protein IMZ08_02635 [Bacillus luteolus]|uniref:Lipoprotein n=1 Tax=Litchfieldia luteola TaxID=682179 RepID=A0ABR9QEN5_9BACI|nr:hypothetical protein [Cytobacillus luteolus]MBE4906953.1 hypothetical protein [Cytobacillus luteolus]MBP1943582.1 hypothetical protein [Cytobacillus luteolus]
MVKIYDYKKGLVSIRILKLSLFVISLLLLSGCFESSSKTEIEHFSTKEKALEHFIKKEKIKGNIDLITTTNKDQLLLTHWTNNTYFVGELKEDEKGYYAERISNYFQMESSGFGWELSALNGNEYTIFLQKSNEPNFIKLSNEKLFVSILIGHTLSTNSKNETNAIKDFDTIKSD